MRVVFIMRAAAGTAVCRPLYRDVYLWDIATSQRGISSCCSSQSWPCLAPPRRLCAIQRRKRRRHQGGIRRLTCDCDAAHIITGQRRRRPAGNGSTQAPGQRCTRSWTGRLRGGLHGWVFGTPVATELEMNLSFMDLLNLLRAGDIAGEMLG